MGVELIKHLFLFFGCLNGDADVLLGLIFIHALRSHFSSSDHLFLFLLPSGDVIGFRTDETPSIYLVMIDALSLSHPNTFEYKCIQYQGGFVVSTLRPFFSIVPQPTLDALQPAVKHGSPFVLRLSFPFLTLPSLAIILFSIYNQLVAFFIPAILPHSNSVLSVPMTLPPLPSSHAVTSASPLSTCSVPYSSSSSVSPFGIICFFFVLFHTLSYTATLLPVFQTLLPHPFLSPDCFLSACLSSPSDFFQVPIPVVLQGYFSFVTLISLRLRSVLLLALDLFPSFDAYIRLI